MRAQKYVDTPSQHRYLTDLTRLSSTSSTRSSMIIFLRFLPSACLLRLCSSLRTSRFAALTNCLLSAGASSPYAVRNGCVSSTSKITATGRRQTCMTRKEENRPSATSAICEFFFGRSTCGMPLCSNGLINVRFSRNQYRYRYLVVM